MKLYEQAAALGSLLFTRGAGVQGYDACRRNLANMLTAEQIVEAKRLAREGPAKIEQGQKE